MENLEKEGTPMPITGRAACAELLQQLLVSPAAKQAGVFKIGLADFKEFNDIFGRHYGDLLLEKIIAYLSSFPAAQLFRPVGVEFLLILPNSGYTRTAEIADEICTRFNETWHIGDMDFICSMNLGFALPPQEAQSGEELMEMLDSAGQEAYRTGQNTAIPFTEALRAGILRTKAIATKLKNALASPDDPDLEVCFRPTVLYDARRYTRAESYVRLFSDVYGLVGEASLIPIAEQSGLATALNLYAIRHTCALIRDLLDAERSFETIAVPVSAVQFLQPKFDEQLKTIIDEYNIPADKLALELTESTLVNSFMQITYMMGQVSDLGVELVLSDFGTGYSGINNILTLPVDVLASDVAGD